MSGAVRAATLLAALIAVPLTVGAQQPAGPTADSLRAVVGRLTARLDSLEAGNCPAGPAVALPARIGKPSSLDSLAAALEQLRDRVERAVAARCPSGAAAQPAQAAAPAADTGKDELAALRAAAAAAAGQAPPAGAADTTGAKPPPPPTPAAA